MAQEMDIEEGPTKNQTSTEVKTKSPKWCSCGRLMLVLLFVAMAVCIIWLAVSLSKLRRTTTEPVVVSTPAPPTDDEDEAPKSVAKTFRFGAVAADSPECSRIGTDILAKHQGSTMDATIASLLCLGVVHFPSAGIGGGFLMTIYDSEMKGIITLNAREVAPLFATEDMYVNNSGLSLEGGMAVAVPGDLAGLAEAHRRYGRLPWAKLFEPAIELSEKGFVVDDFVDYVIQDKAADILKSPSLSDLLIKADGTFVRKGDTLKRPAFAETLRKIAEGGAEVFYNGSLGEDIVKEIQESGGNITLDDLRQYKPVWKDPVSVRLGDYTLNGPPPPSSAAIMYYILNIMEGYNVSSADWKTLDSRVLLVHRLVESMKFGFGKRSYLGDEDFVNVTEWLDLLTSEDYAAKARLKIKDDSVLPFAEYDSAYELPPDAGTTHLSVYGPDGMAVSVTSTINTYLGNKVIGNRTGIVYNNEMDDFSTPGMSNVYGLAASPSNYIVPGKRPMSSMSPTIVLDKDNQVHLVVGSSGGSRIISGTLEVILNSIWLDFNVTEALDLPRYHHQLLPDYILYEPSLPMEIRRGLIRKGHKFQPRISPFCVTQLIKLECQDHHEMCLLAACDRRRNGIPDGF